VVDQAQGEVVAVEQADPHSNNIHVAHNNPRDSDIQITQTNPFNTTIHISLNVGTGCKSVVRLTNARNVQLHLSYNGMGNSEAEVEITGAFNTTVHLSFQNPRNTPVKVTMNDASISSLHVSQNIPQNSPMEVTMESAENNQVHLSQSVPMSSPLTWKLTGDVESNQIEVSQNAADKNSPLDCSPECPQEEYVYDYQYAGGDTAGHGGGLEDNVIEDDFEYDAVEVEQKAEPAAAVPEYVEYDEPELDLDYEAGDEYSVYAEEEEDNTVQKHTVQDNTVQDNTVQDNTVQDEDSTAAVGGACPGGDLESCVDVCPGQYGARVFGLCVGSCGRRCP